MIVGFGHRAQVGKDTAGDWLVNQGWERLAFADLVRQVLYTLDPVVDPYQPTTTSASRTWSTRWAGR